MAEFDTVLKPEIHDLIAFRVKIDQPYVLFSSIIHKFTWKGCVEMETNDTGCSSKRQQELYVLYGCPYYWTEIEATWVDDPSWEGRGIQEPISSSLLLSSRFSLFNLASSRTLLTVKIMVSFLKGLVTKSDTPFFNASSAASGEP